MQPERPAVGLSQHRRQADSGPQGELGTGLLQGLVQTARLPSFCFLLPRVHAADVAAAQPAQMPSSSTGPVPAPIPAPSALPRNVGKPEFPDTGWDRIKDLFNRELVFFVMHHQSAVLLMNLISDNFSSAAILSLCILSTKGKMPNNNNNNNNVTFVVWWCTFSSYYIDL